LESIGTGENYLLPQYMLVSRIRWRALSGEERKGGTYGYNLNRLNGRFAQGMEKLGEGSACIGEEGKVRIVWHGGHRDVGGVRKESRFTVTSRNRGAKRPGKGGTQATSDPRYSRPEKSLTSKEGAKKGKKRISRRGSLGQRKKTFVFQENGWTSGTVAKAKNHQPKIPKTEKNRGGRTWEKTSEDKRGSGKGYKGCETVPREESTENQTN